MCDFPNVENNDVELDALIAFCDDWSRRIASLNELYGKGYADESLILCCCYVEAIAKLFYGLELDGEESFIKALLRFGENEVFGRINPRLLLERLAKMKGERGDLTTKLSLAFAGFQDRFYPSEEIMEACKPVLSNEELFSLENCLWMGTVAGLAHKITKCEGVHNGMIQVRSRAETVLDFRLLYPALIRIFEKARRRVLSGKLRTY